MCCSFEEGSSPSEGPKPAFERRGRGMSAEEGEE